MDVRGDAGYVLLPPSVHPSGALYRWQGNLDEVAALPTELVPLIQGQPGDRPKADQLPAWMIPWLEVLPGARNNTMTRFVGWAYREGHDDPTVLAMALGVNSQWPVPLERRELEAIIRSIGAKQAKNRKRKPENGNVIQESASAAPVSTLARSHAVTRAVATVQAERVSWLSPGRIPLGKITVVEGHPGLGKTHILCDLAARVTRGEGFPDDPAIDRGGVVLLSGEDGVADTLRPRLEAAGADLNAVWILEHIRSARGDPEPVELPLHVPEIQVEVQNRGARLVVIDPFEAYLSDEVDSFKSHDVRRALVPLKEMAERTGCAIVIVRHLRKSGGGLAITAGGGSIAIVAAARSGLLVAQDPNDPARRILASVKSNLAKPPANLCYRLVDGPVGSRVEWLGTTETTADELIAAHGEMGGSAMERAERVDCRTWLRGYLEREGRTTKQAAVSAGEAEGFRRRTIERAAFDLGIKARKGFGAPGWWQLPPSNEAESQPPISPPVPFSPGLERGEHGEIGGSGEIGRPPSGLAMELEI
jgi:hypothetical protein